jgi:hypothetical protein
MIFLFPYITSSLCIVFPLFPISPLIWGKSIEWDHIMKGKTKYSGGVKIRDKKIEGWVGNGRVRVSSHIVVF